jgi:putative transposase
MPGRCLVSASDQWARTDVAEVADDAGWHTIYSAGPGFLPLTPPEWDVELFVEAPPRDGESKPQFHVILTAEDWQEKVRVFLAENDPGTLDTRRPVRPARHAFISYSRHDQASVDDLVSHLRESGVTPWIEPDDTAARHPDLVRRDFTAAAPNQLWVLDLTYVPTWAGGVAYVCFIVDVFSRMIVGWRVASHMATTMVLDAVDMASWSRGARIAGLRCHSDAGSQFTSVR